MKEERLRKIKKFCKQIDNFDGELTIIGANAYHNGIIVFTFN